MGYVVTAPLVIVRDESGSSHHFYEGAAVPDGMDKEHLKQLADDGMIEKVKAPKPAAESEKSDKVEDILEEVGDDQEKAAAALEAENAKGDKARVTLVAALEAIADPDS